MAKADCSELSIKITNIAENLSSRGTIKNLDDVVREMAKLIPGMNRETVVSAIVEATATETKKVDTLVKKINAIKQEARDDKNLHRKITNLERFLEEGTLPGVKRKADKTTTAIRLLRSIRNDLSKRLAKTEAAKKRRQKKAEPKVIKNLKADIAELESIVKSKTVPTKAKKKGITVSNAVKKLRNKRDQLKKRIAKSEPVKVDRLRKQIEDLDKRLLKGDIFPKAKEAKTKQSKEIERLEFERNKRKGEIRRRIQGLKPKSVFERFVANPFNAARNIMTSFDLSGVLRQGGFIAFGRPVTAAKALVPMFKAFASEKQQMKIEAEIEARPNAPLYKKAGLFIAPTDGTYKLSEREEIMQSDLIELMEKIPGIGRIIAGSNRAYTTFLNVLRADAFDIMSEGLSRDGDVTLDEAKSVANYVNTATGRGTLGKLEQAAVGLNVAFFAPRYVASRFQLLTLQPIFKAKTPRARKQIAKEYARYLIGMAMVYALASLTLDDEEFEWDPRSSDFGKIKIGNTRLDPLSGISQITVLLSRLALGETKSSTSGRITPIRGEDVPFGRSGASGVLGRFLRGKLSPMFGTALNVLEGENVIGEEVTFSSEAFNLLTPISLGEVLETLQAQGIPRGTALSILSIFGMGIQTYGVTKNESSSSGFSK